MQRTLLAASVLSLGILISPNAFPRAHAQTQAQAQPARTPTQPAPEATRSTPDKGPNVAPKKSDDATRPPAKRASKDEAQVNKTVPEAKRGQLEERDEPSRTRITGLDKKLEPSAAPPAHAAKAVRVEDPNLKVDPPLSGEIEPTTEAARDQRLRERVQAALLQSSTLSYTARLVSVAVKGGEITLRGQLNTQFEKVHVERLVDGIRGDHVVHNELKVRSVTGAARVPEAR